MIYSLQLPLPGVKPTSKSEYLKIFRDVIWEAALHGCNSRSKAVQQNPAAEPTQQQQQQKVVGGLPAQVTYDAVLSVGSPLASQQLLFALRQAEKAKVARLPVIVQYMVSEHNKCHQANFTLAWFWRSRHSGLVVCSSDCCVSFRWTSGVAVDFTTTLHCIHTDDSPLV